jgi:hypothetical protein
VVCLTSKSNDTRLWSERHGGDLPLTKEGFATLLHEVFDSLRRGGYFAEVLNIGARWKDVFAGSEGQAAAFFAMKLGDPWPVATMRYKPLLAGRNDDDIFTLIELLHRDVVSEPVGEAPTYEFDKAAAKRVSEKHQSGARTA